MQVLDFLDLSVHISTMNSMNNGTTAALHTLSLVLIAALIAVAIAVSPFIGIAHLLLALPLFGLVCLWSVLIGAGSVVLHDPTAYDVPLLDRSDRAESILGGSVAVACGMFLLVATFVTPVATAAHFLLMIPLITASICAGILYLIEPALTIYVPVPSHEEVVMAQMLQDLEELRKRGVKFGNYRGGQMQVYDLDGCRC